MSGKQVEGGGMCYWIGEMSAPPMEEMGEDFCPDFLQPFLENIVRKSCNDGSRELIQVFHNPWRWLLP